MIDRIKSIVKSEYPRAFSDLRTSVSLETILSPKIVELPKSVLDRVQTDIAKIFDYSRSENHLEHIRPNLSPEDQELLSHKTTNSSVLMSYDFHYNFEADQLSLIEINTNAANFLFSELVYRGQELSAGQNAIESLLSSFRAEAYSAGQDLKLVHLIDEDLERQKSYPEFLMFTDLFEKNGIQCKILDFQDAKVLSDNAFIYNRYCDFTLNQERSKHLRKGFLTGSNIFSPNPWEYLVLADKDRMDDFEHFKICDSIIPQKDFQNFQGTEELWAERKKYFFKPKRSHGAKAVFNGGSISRKRFYEIFNEEFIAQEFRPPGEIDGWKFDLRFYVYKKDVQLYIARIYKGQLTNFSTPGSGFAAIVFK